MSSFRIGHLYSFDLKFLQRRPALIRRFGFTGAVRQVAVLAANGADAMTIFPANPLHRQREQNKLPQNIFQLYAAAFIEGDFTFSFVDLHILFVSGAFGGTIEEIKIGVDRKLGRFQTPVTIRLHPDFQVSLYPDFSQRVGEQLRAAYRFERRDLAKSLIVLDLTRREGHVETDL